MAKKLLQSINVPDDADTIKAALDKRADHFPSLSAKKQTVEPPQRQIERISKHINVPVYVWEQVRKMAFEQNVPANVFVMKALQTYGIKIDEEDLVDARTLR